MASEGLRYPFYWAVLQKPRKGFSPLVFDLLPNPSIDHLVAVILKYPRREESGRRKCLNFGPTPKAVLAFGLGLIGGKGSARILEHVVLEHTLDRVGALSG
jgi:hypothetical protein